MRAATPSRPMAAVAGVLAAASALAAAELVTGSAGRGPSVIGAVGSRLIDRFAAPLKDVAVRLFGTHDKDALVVGVIVVCLVIGAVVGAVARRRPRVGDVALAAFGAVGWLAYRADALARPVVGVAACGVASATGALVLRGLLHVAPRRPPRAVTVHDGVAIGDAIAPSPSPRIDAPGIAGRRRFVVAGVTVGAGATVMAVSGRRLRPPSGVGDDEVTLPALVRRAPGIDAAPPPIDGLSPYLTPNDRFYRIDTALGVPQVDRGSWRLTVDGMVDRPFSLSYDELLAMDAVEEVVTLQCVSNGIGGPLVGNARWQGVRLHHLLERAGVQGGAAQVVGRSVDRWTAGFPLDIALDGRTALVAYAMNGEVLPAAHGFPARLVVAGLYGYVSATKWLRQIELTTWDAVDGYWITRGWAKEAPIKTASRIDVPRPGAQLVPGPTTIAGVAWSPPRGIAAVEVQVDDGPWQQATLGETASGSTWVQWWVPWKATPGPHLARVRATDATGAVQTEEVRPPDPDGATGWHSRWFTVAK